MFIILSLIVLAYITASVYLGCVAHRDFNSKSSLFTDILAVAVSWPIIAFFYVTDYFGGLMEKGAKYWRSKID